jgi:hypothetical protein
MTRAQLAAALVLASMSVAHAQQQSAPAYCHPVHAAALDRKAAADLVKALANSEIPARIAVPLINEISGQISPQAYRMPRSE